MSVPKDRYPVSPRPYNPHPPEWEYPQGTGLIRLNRVGSMSLDGVAYFVSLALAGEHVALEKLEETPLLKYRHMYLRELDLNTGRTKPLVLPVSLP